MEEINFEYRFHTFGTPAGALKVFLGTRSDAPLLLAAMIRGKGTPAGRQKLTETDGHRGLSAAWLCPDDYADGLRLEIDRPKANELELVAMVAEAARAIGLPVNDPAVANATDMGRVKLAPPTLTPTTYLHFAVGRPFTHYDKPEDLPPVAERIALETKVTELLLHPALQELARKHLVRIPAAVHLG